MLRDAGAQCASAFRGIERLLPQNNEDTETNHLRAAGCRAVCTDHGNPARETVWHPLCYPLHLRLARLRGPVVGAGPAGRRLPAAVSGFAAVGLAAAPGPAADSGRGFRHLAHRPARLPAPAPGRTTRHRIPRQRRSRTAPPLCRHPRKIRNRILPGYPGPTRLREPHRHRRR